MCASGSLRSLRAVLQPTVVAEGQGSEDELTILTQLTEVRRTSLTGWTSVPAAVAARRVHCTVSVVDV